MYVDPITYFILKSLAYDTLMCNTAQPFQSFCIWFLIHFFKMHAHKLGFVLTSISLVQDDAHIFCLEDQIKDEIRGVLDLTEETLSQFGFDKYEINLSTRPEKSVGEDDIWEKATSALKDALDDKGWTYQIDDGGGAFYGPKIDVKIEDALGRKWQCSTIQAIPNLKIL